MQMQEGVNPANGLGERSGPPEQHWVTERRRRPKKARAVTKNLLLEAEEGPERRQDGRREAGKAPTTVGLCPEKAPGGPERGPQGDQNGSSAAEWGERRKRERTKKHPELVFWLLEGPPGALWWRHRRPKKAPRRRPDGRGGPREAVRTAAESIRRVDDGRKSSQRCTGAPREAPGEAQKGQNRQHIICFTRFFACVDVRVHVSRKEVERHPERPKVGRRTVKISPGGPEEGSETGPVGSRRGL